MQISRNKSEPDGFLRFDQVLGTWEELYALGWKISDVPRDSLTRLMSTAKVDASNQVVLSAINHYVQMLPFNDFPSDTVVVPIPRHDPNLSTRGTVQWNLKERIVKRFELTDGSGLVYRIKQGRSFSRNALPENERIRELKDALICDHSDHKQYARAIVVDDFMTTGVSAASLCRLLFPILDLPRKITVVVFGKHERKRELPTVSNSHLTRDGFWATVDPKHVFHY